MNTTSISLLERLRGPNAGLAWSDFVELYAPLLHEWTRRLGVCDADAHDLVQEVFLILLRKLPTFQYDKSRTFRGYLHTVLLNKWHEQGRRKALPVDRLPEAVEQVAVPDDTIAFAEEEYRQFLVRQALLLMQREFQEQTWKMCWEYIVNGKSAAAVATELGTTAGAVRVATSRVLARLRGLLEGLVV